MLDVVRACDLPARPSGRRWLVDQLWSEEAVGVLGGEPKCLKSYLSLDIAVAVASGRPCLRRFRVDQPGRVLIFAAEDALWDVRSRLEGIAQAVGVAFTALDIHVITVPVIRLDLQRDREELESTIAAIKPRLVILDPFVRMHRVDENSVSEVAPLLAYLRTIQRKYRTAVLLVHHARKGAAHMRGGQALRGSSELHAWGDSNLYMRRRSGALLLTVEHRNAPSIGGLSVDLVTHGSSTAIEIVETTPAPSGPTAVSPEERIVTALATAGRAMTMRQIRTASQMRAETVSAILGQLALKGRVERTNDGYRLVPASGQGAIPAAS